MTKQGCCFQRSNFIMANRKLEQRTANSYPCRVVVAGAGSSRQCRTGQLVQDWQSLDMWSLVQVWYLLMLEGDRWFSTSSCLCRTSSCLCRKVVTGSGLVVAGAGLVVAGAGRWSLLGEGGRWCWVGSCLCKEVIAGARRQLLVPPQMVYTLSELDLKRAVRLRGQQSCLLHCAVSGGV